jgi:Ser/Thr protein kinase RdoA (MazF antagonist)
MAQRCRDFTSLTPDLMLDAVEDATGRSLVGFAHPYKSYINRVYELQCTDGERLVVKFYRPGRWSEEALRDEHAFVSACAAEEIPVVPPMPLRSGDTLGRAADIFFAVFPKRWGRGFEACSADDWRRLGRIVSRMHIVGAREPASARVVMHPYRSTRDDLTDLREGGYVTPREHAAFFAIAEEIIELAGPLFEEVELIRIHGDCHAQNILERPDEGLMLIDFDDMVMGPAIQDLWMLLPDHADACRHEINFILEGYETFQEFDDRMLRLIEPLRAMRMLYFLAWCSRQLDDPNYKQTFPDWGSDGFWRQQVGDLRQQLSVIREHL